MSTMKQCTVRVLAASLTAVLLSIAPGFDTAAQAKGPRRADTSITADSTSAFVGQAIPIAFAVGNAGPGDATGVTVTITIPPQLQLDSSRMTGCTATQTTATCPLGTIPAGAGVADFAWLIAVAEGAASVTFTVTADQRDPDPSNNSSVAVVTITSSADVSISMSAGLVTAGQPFFLPVNAGNAGPSPAEAVVVTVQFPAGLSLLNPGSCATVSASSCTLSIGSLPASGGAVALLQLVAATPGTFTVQATVSAATPDPNPANNSSTAVVTAT